ncbi:hypothetical protein MQE36_03095 [Zhouia spongiae]|uniref:Isoleucyl-tRNA synthetase n=1 Tax=Zhouia spongiae TaxID=2202721 RepID=A0ABY3YND1_9FLAO|nr:hypothetical protein [Zhouia spongiae]UNY99335.1 hypothetical protein MQE36_03095 [Zhouia spongiae]
MKRFLQILFIAIMVTMATGFYFKMNDDNLTGDRLVGIGVLAIAFILIPFFIYHRSKGKKIQDYMFTQENIDKMNNKKGDSTENQ